LAGEASLFPPSPFCIFLPHTGWVRRRFRIFCPPPAASLCVVFFLVLIPQCPCCSPHTLTYLPSCPFNESIIFSPSRLPPGHSFFALGRFFRRAQNSFLPRHFIQELFFLYDLKINLSTLEIRIAPGARLALRPIILGDVSFFF